MDFQEYNRSSLLGCFSRSNPFKSLYEPDPPVLLKHWSRFTSIDHLDDQVTDKNLAFEAFKEHINAARSLMKNQADK